MDLENLSDDRQTSNRVKERVTLMKERKIERAAIRRYVNKENIEVGNVGENYFHDVALSLDDVQFQNLLNQFKYAGRQTINYYVMLGVGETNFEDLENLICGEFPSREGVEDEPKRPYYVKSEIMGSRLYVVFGYYLDHGTVDPETGARKSSLGSKRAILVVEEDSDLVEVRVSDRPIARKIRDSLSEATGQSKNTVYKPNFGSEFQKEFNQYVEKYTSLKVRTKEKEGSTVSTIRFTSGQDDAGNREDAREDKRVSKELMEEGSTITMGYAELQEGLKFRINREQSKISLRKYEMEALLNQITELINDVLERTGGYPQKTLREVSNVSE